MAFITLILLGFSMATPPAPNSAGGPLPKKTKYAEEDDLRVAEMMATFMHSYMDNNHGKGGKGGSDRRNDSSADDR